jgi:hypothetical protein
LHISRKDNNVEEVSPDLRLTSLHFALPQQGQEGKKGGVTVTLVHEKSEEEEERLTRMAKLQRREGPTIRTGSMVVEG